MAQLTIILRSCWSLTRSDARARITSRCKWLCPAMRVGEGARTARWPLKLTWPVFLKRVAGVLAKLHHQTLTCLYPSRHLILETWTGRTWPPVVCFLAVSTTTAARALTSSWVTCCYLPTPVPEWGSFILDRLVSRYLFSPVNFWRCQEEWHLF